MHIQRDNVIARKKVIVIIPRFKEKLENTETISLNQAMNLLSGYDICYISPEKMRSYYQRINENAEFFSDECFESVKSYSLLMLSPVFYKRFLDYEYMLIYQLDAFVFYDKLNYFCNMGYDYIGAPLPYWVGWPYTVNRVGNGGLSLRNVGACYKAVKEYMPYVAAQEPFLMSKLLSGEYGEDCYFIYCGWCKAIDFRTAPTKVAISFSLQTDFNHVYASLSESNLPFGCHAWNRLSNMVVWKPYIEHRGYDLSANTHKENNYGDGYLLNAKKMKAYGMISYLIDEMIRLDVKEVRQRVLEVLPESNQMVIWGNGSVGHRAVKLLSYLDKDIAFIIDKKASPEQKENDINVVSPNVELIKGCGCPIIIASINYGDEIADNLSKMRLRLNEDYFFFLDFEKMIAIEISTVMYKGRLHDWLYKKIMD